MSGILGTSPTPALTRREHKRLAKIVLLEHARGRPAPRFTAVFPEFNGGDAARIRRLVLDERLAAGDQLAGARVYETASECVWGYVTISDLSCDGAGTIPNGIAAKLRRNLTAPPDQPDVLFDATDAVIATSAPTSLPSGLIHADAVTATCVPPPVMLLDRDADPVPYAASLLWLAAELLAAQVELRTGLWLITSS